VLASVCVCVLAYHETGCGEYDDGQEIAGKGSPFVGRYASYELGQQQTTCLHLQYFEFLWAPTPWRNSNFSVQDCQSLATTFAMDANVTHPVLENGPIDFTLLGLAFNFALHSAHFQWCKMPLIFQLLSEFQYTFTSAPTAVEHLSTIFLVETREGHQTYSNLVTDKP